MNRRMLLLGIAVCAAGLVVGVVTQANLLRQGQVSIYPPLIELAQLQVEGEPIEVQFELRNESKSNLTVTSLSTSCGCMALSVNQEPAKVPCELMAGAVIPINLRVATFNRLGQQTFRLSAVASGPSGALPEVQAALHANVIGTLRAEPAAILFRDAKPNTPYVAEVELADMLPAGGEGIGEITSSNPRSIQVEVNKADGPSTIFGPGVAATIRGRLKVTFLADASNGHLQETISIVPTDSRQPTLRIPVHCEMAGPEYRFIPDGLTFTGQPGPSKRTIVFNGAKPLAIELVPKGIEVEIGEIVNGSRDIRLVADTRQFDQDLLNLIFLVDGQSIKFPIRRISLP